MQFELLFHLQSLGDSTNLLRVPGHTSQSSLNSLGSQGEPEVKMARSLFDYEVSTPYCL